MRLGALPGTQQPDNRGAANPELLGDGPLSDPVLAKPFHFRHEFTCIEEHYTDTGEFTDHVFALCHLLGFRFAPRIRNLGDTRLYSMENRPAIRRSLRSSVGL